ncbi:MAG: aldose epimerase family protein [Planctomycetia bacterium]
MSISLAVSILQGSGVRGESAVKNEPVVKPPAIRSFGTLPDGREAHLYTLEVPGGWKATITDYGGILTGFHVPVRESTGEKTVDIVLGFESLDGYLAGHPYFGAICGRVANRIAQGRFTLDGNEHRLATNNGEHHLHGGTIGFDKLLWKATPHLDATGPALDLVLVSPDGDEGYPGQLTARVTYRLTRDGELWVEMTAETDAPTLVNLAHHSYWNLAGQALGTIHGHELAVVADRYLPVDAGSIPTGELAAVEQTPFDLRPERPARRLGDAIAALPPSSDGKNPGGIDHTFVIRDWKPDGALRPAAVLRDPVSGRTMEVLTDQPGVQVYTGNYLDGSLTGKAAATYAKQAGVCLETQTFPDTAHHPEWPTQRLEPGGVYRHTMVHRFRP